MLQVKLLCKFNFGKFKFSNLVQSEDEQIFSIATFINITQMNNNRIFWDKKRIRLGKKTPLGM